MAESESFEARKRHENPQNDEFEEEEEEEDEEILDDEEEDEGARQLTEPHQLQLTENNKHYKGSFFLSFAFFLFFIFILVLRVIRMIRQVYKWILEWNPMKELNWRWETEAELFIFELTA